MLNRWQQDNHLFILNKNINNIIVPGTHDSGAYILSPNYEGSLYKKIGAKMDIVKNWTICQNFSIAYQLNIGVRHFDIRLTKENNEYYVSHTFICDKLSNILDQFYDFLMLNKEEFIFILFDPDAHGNFDRENDWDEFLEILMNKFNDIITISDNMKDKYRGEYKDFIKNSINYKKFPSYINVLKSGKRLYCYIKEDKSFKNPWIDVSNTEEKYNYLLENYNQYDNKNYNILSFTVTPQKGDIIKSFFCPCSNHTTLKTLSESIHDKFNDFINEERYNVSCYMIDFIDSDITKRIIDLNKDY